MKTPLVKNIYVLLDKAAPFATQLPYDNAGLLCGDENAKVSGITVCLDITPETVDFAKQAGHNLIVSHHPVIFKPVSNVLDGSIPYLLIQNGISAICAHTNLDAAAGGVNDRLCALLGIANAQPFDNGEFQGFPPVGRIGEVTDTDTYTFLEKVKNALHCDIRYFDSGKRIRRVAVCGGSGFDLAEAAKNAGADAFVTADIRHHEWLEAKELDLTLIDAGHFCTEYPITKDLEEMLQTAFAVPVAICPQSPPYRIF